MKTKPHLIIIIGAFAIVAIVLFTVTYFESVTKNAVLPEKKLVLVHRVDTDKDFKITWKEIRQLMYMIAEARISN